jgi:tetratricopeptide (TPR) repeat protein
MMVRALRDDCVVLVNPAELFTGSDRLIEANHLNGMGAVLEKRQEFAEAERRYEEALAIYEEIFGQQHYTTAVVTRNLARVLRIQGKTAEASLLEDVATDILSRRGDTDEAKKTPFGGSAGFFELLGNAYTKPLEEELEAEEQQAP